MTNLRGPVMATGISMLGPVVPFVIGALALDLQEELNLTSGLLGLAIGLFFAVSALSSVPAGIAIERMGAVTAARLAGVVNGTALLLLAAVVRGWWGLAGVMVLAAVGNAVAHPSVNGIISEMVDEGRHGLMLGFKQAAAPGALLIAGLVVPLSLAVASWRVLIGGLAFIGIALALGLRGVRGRPRGRRSLSLERHLVALGLVSAGGIAAMNGGGAFLVAFGAEAGLAVDAAGWVLVGGSLLGMATRVVAGITADRHRVDPGRVMLVMLVVGGIGTLAMPALYPWAVVLMCVGVWGWQGLMHLLVVRRYSDNPAAATGVVEVGTYVGGGLGPVVFGQAVEHATFTLGWTLMAAAALGAGLVLATLRRRQVPQV